MATGSGSFTTNDENISKDSTNSGNGPSICELYKTKQWLHNQLIELSAALKEAEDDDTEELTDLEAIEERTKTLGDELKEVAGDNWIEQQLLERTQLSDIMIKVLFPQQGHDSENDEIRKKIIEDVETQNDVSALIMAKHKELVGMRQEYTQTRKERIEVMARNRELMDQVKEAQNNTDGNQFTNDQQVERARNALDEEMSKAKIIRGIFQGFIIGSGIHWAKDQYLQELLIEMGQPLRRVLGDQ